MRHDGCGWRSGRFRRRRWGAPFHHHPHAAIDAIVTVSTERVLSAGAAVVAIAIRIIRARHPSADTGGAGRRRRWLGRLRRGRRRAGAGRQRRWNGGLRRAAERWHVADHPTAVGGHPSVYSSVGSERAASSPAHDADLVRPAVDDDKQRACAGERRDRPLVADGRIQGQKGGGSGGAFRVQRTTRVTLA